MLEWTDRLQTAMVGHPDAVFSPLDRRYMYVPFDQDGPRGQVNLDTLHEHFYDSPAVYERVLQCKVGSGSRAAVVRPVAFRCLSSR